MSDLIDRQAAIDALVEILDRPNHAEFLYGDEICGALGSLPSAQPKVEKDTNVPINDCISKQAAIDAIRAFYDEFIVYDNGKSIEDLISELPSAQPEIIRCKDCKFFVSDMEWCEADDGNPTSPDAFCSWAERRTDE